MGEKTTSPGPGHNSAPSAIARDQLRSIVERIERLEEEKAAIADDIKEVYAEAKANGYDTKTLRAVIRIRKQDSAERQEQEALLDLYLAALGMAVRDEVDHAPQTREQRARARTSEAMEDNKEFASELLKAGLISEEAHAEHVRLSDAVANKLGAGVKAGKGSLRQRVGKSVKDAVAAMGTPTELTEEEKAKGYTAAFIGKDGTRMAVGVGMKV